LKSSVKYSIGRPLALSVCLCVALLSSPCCCQDATQEVLTEGRVSRGRLWQRLERVASLEGERRCRPSSRSLFRSALLHVAGDVASLAQHCNVSKAAGHSSCLRGAWASNRAVSVHTHSWQYHKSISQLSQCNWLQDELQLSRNTAQGMLASLESLYADAPELAYIRQLRPGASMIESVNEVLNSSTRGASGLHVEEVLHGTSWLQNGTKSIPWSLAEVVDATSVEWCQTGHSGCSEAADACFAVREAVSDSHDVPLSDVSLEWSAANMRFLQPVPGQHGLCLRMGSPAAHLQRLVEIQDQLHQLAVSKPIDRRASSLLERGASRTLLVAKSKFIGAIIQLPAVFLLACLHAVAVLVYLPVVMFQMVMNVIALPFTALGGFGEMTKWLLLLPGCTLSVILRVCVNAAHVGLDWVYFVGSFMGFKGHAPYSNLWSSNVCGDPGPDWPIMSTAWIA